MQQRFSDRCVKAIKQCTTYEGRIFVSPLQDLDCVRESRTCSKACKKLFVGEVTIVVSALI